MHLFEDMPPTKARLTDIQLERTFEAMFWPYAWARGTPPMKVEKKGALREYRKAVRSGDTPEFLAQAIKIAAVRFTATDPQYRPSVRKWLLNGGQHDEVVPVDRVDDIEHSWRLRAANIIAGGKESPAVVKGCYERGMITREQMETVL